MTAYSFAAGNADLDTDGDGMNDGDEANLGTDPTISNGVAMVWIRFPESGRRLP